MTLEEYEASIAAKRAALNKVSSSAKKAAADPALEGLKAFKRVDVEAEVSELTDLQKERKDGTRAREAKERQTLVPGFRVGGGDDRGGGGGGGRGGGGRGRGDRDRDRDR